MAVSMMEKSIIYKTYTVSTIANSNVSPFGALVQFDIDSPSGYIPFSHFISAPNGSGISANSTSFKMFENTGTLYSKSAFSNFRVTIGFIKD